MVSTNSVMAMAKTPSLNVFKRDLLMELPAPAGPRWPTRVGQAVTCSDVPGPSREWARQWGQPVARTWSQIMSARSSLPSTTDAGCSLSMWPMSPL